MVTREFGNEIFISSLSNLHNGITDKKTEAEQWSIEDASKIHFHRAITGYNLQWEAI
jgi:hypothetical protein